MQLGRVLVEAGRPDLAEPYLRQAIAGFERLAGEAARANLSAALGDLANAYQSLGRLSEALAAAERGLGIARELGLARNVAAGLGQAAAILREQGRYAEAGARYAEALAQAEAAGDLGLQGLILQHQGSLEDDLEHFDQAVALYRRALERFQAAGHRGGQMRTCDLLGTAERERGQYAASEAWYARAKELAEALGDRRQQASVAHNLGVLYQERAQAAAGPADRAAGLRRALAAVQESLAIARELGDRVGQAQSLFQLGVVHMDLDDPVQAEPFVLEGLRIDEELEQPDVYKDYNLMARIARAKGDERAAVGWQAKSEAKKAELERLARGEGTQAAQQAQEQQEKQLFEYFLALGQACYQARQSGAPLEPQAAEALAQMAQADPPWREAAAFLLACAAGQPPPPVPPGLPKRVREVLEMLADGG